MSFARMHKNAMLILVLGLALLLRLEDLQQPLVDAFSWREASTAMMADNLPRNGWNPLWPEVSWTGDQPGYQGREFQSLTIGAAALDALFGWRDWHGRLIAVLCGCITTFSLYRLTLVLFGWREALTTALFYAVLPGAILIDRSYLPDPAMLALTVTFLWLFCEGLARRKASWLTAAWFVGTLSLLSKLPAAATLISVGYLAVVALPKQRKAANLTILTAAFAVSTIIIVTYYGWAIYLGNTYPPFHIAGRGWIWDEGLSGFWSEAFYFRKFIDHAQNWLWAPMILPFCAVGLIVTRKETRDAQPGIVISAPFFMHFWLLGCFVFYIIAAREVTENPWNLHVFNPLVAVLASRGLWAIVRMLQPVRGAVSSTVVVIVVTSAVVGVGRPKVKMMKSSFAQDDFLLGERLNEISKQGDLVVVSGTVAGTPIAIYYSRRRGWIYPSPEMTREYSVYIDDDARAVAGLNNFVSRGANWFGIVKESTDFHHPRRRFLSHHTNLIAFLQAHASVAAETDRYVVYDLSRLRRFETAP